MGIRVVELGAIPKSIKTDLFLTSAKSKTYKKHPSVIELSTNNDGLELCPDNPDFKETRQKLREHLFETLWQKAYEQEGKGRKTPKQMEEMLANMMKPSTVNDEGLKDLRIWNFAKVEPTGFRGEALDQKISELLTLKKAGITTIIDPDGIGGYQEICEKNGLKYVRYESLTLSETKENLISFIEAINEGHYYIGCSYGTVHTDIALGVARVLNPKNKLYENTYLVPAVAGGVHKGNVLSLNKKVEPKALKIHDENLYRISVKRCKDLAALFTESDRQRLGWPPDFEKTIPERIKKELDRIKS
ncbi:MAG: hypothetical protein WCY19_07685 [Candidatus Gastranaerophilaceae bacterium]